MTFLLGEQGIVSEERMSQERTLSWLRTHVEFVSPSLLFLQPLEFFPVAALGSQSYSCSDVHCRQYGATRMVRTR